MVGWRVAMFALCSSALVACGDYAQTETYGDGSYEVRIGAANDSDSELTYGWSTPMTTKLPGAKAKDGDASHSLAGHTLAQVVRSPKVRIRADDKSCVTCHSWAAYQDRETFCQRVDDFLKMPTSSKDPSKDPASAKPAHLKKLLKDWQDAGCPE